MQKLPKINLKISRWLLIYLCALHSVVLFGIIQFQLDLWHYLCLLGGLTASGVCYWYYYFGQGRVVAFKILGDRVQVFKSARMREFSLAERHFESGQVILLRLDSSVFGLGRGLALFADAIDRDQYRQLRAALRFPA